MTRTVQLICLLLLWACAAPLTLGAEPASPATAEAAAFFESKIRPILVARCFECHGPESKAEGGLRVDSRSALLSGGSFGAAIKPGDPKGSLLIDAVNHGDIVQMPPKSKMPAQEIADLTAWVAAGAPWPEAKDDVPLRKRNAGFTLTDEDRNFWAFRLPREPEVPQVRNPGWCQSPLDRFVLAPLEARNLQPAPAADKRTLIRRATFDLHGLPPSIEEVEAFLADQSPEAFARVVDRLLASPRYGERWGRHWLDIARYADSNGMDENMAMAHAWRYRDYVIRAFNRDLPYDQFIRQQLAGDLLPAPDDATRYDQLVATAFLVLGPKMLAEDDPVKMEMDIIDEQVDTIGRAFMGLTLGCARCHDHKYDPLPTSDYYALAGIFKSTKTMENFTVVAMWSEQLLGTSDEVARLKAHEEESSRLTADMKEQQKNGASEMALAAIKQRLAELEKSKPNVPRTLAVASRAPQNLRVHLRGNHLTQGDEVPRGFPQVLQSTSSAGAIATDQSGRVELANWLSRADHPLTSRVMANRVWQGHFGEGLVRSPDNFGKLGEQPDNQPLLDWLARRLVDSGWSLKSLHRQIMLSSAYQMSTRYDAAAAGADPENRLLWRMNRRRLEAEAIRDALVACGGQMDLSMGGTLLANANHTYVTSTASVNDVKYDNGRRSVYLPVIRSAVFDVFSAFDFADPSTMNGHRPTTTVAPQALFMMNSTLVLKQTRAMAERLLSDTADDPARVDRAYQLAYSRPASSAEVSRALEFVARYRADLEQQQVEPVEAQRRAWQALCRVILSANEFIYVE